MRLELIIISIILVVFGVYIGVRSSFFECVHTELAGPPKLEGATAINDILSFAEQHFQPKIEGPESIIVDNDNSYITGLKDGRVVQIQNKKIRKTFRFGIVKPEMCDGNYNAEPLCGRPLGMRRLDDNRVIAVDSYSGIYLIDFERGNYSMIIRNGAEVSGKPMKFLNDVDIVNDDTLIFTDSSSKWDLRDYMIILLEGIPNGRVFRLTRSTGEIDVLLDKLYFANGIQLFPDKQSFLVSETGAARIKRHWIAGPRAGETEIFIDNLPGLPDNIRPGSDETFWVGLSSVRHNDSFSMLDFLADKPFIRKFILQIVPTSLWSSVLKYFKPKHSMIIQLNKDGQIIASAHDPEGEKITEVSEVVETDQYLYLGSFDAHFIARVRKNLFQ